MKFVTGMTRGRASRIGLVAGIAVAGLIGLTLPASAHHADVSGWTSCSNGVHVVHWTITNSQSDMAMTIDSATAAIGATPYTVDGYTSPVDNSGSTSATSTVPGNVTGVITATVSVSWPDHYSVISTGEVDIPSSCCGCSTTTTAPTTTTTYEVTTTTRHKCGCSTTTTTQPATTTTAPTTTTTAATTTTTAATTTTTQPVETTTSTTQVLGSTTLFTTTTVKPTTTTLHEQGSTVPTTEATTTTLPTGTVNLPRTGGSVEFPAILGGLCIAAGSALALRKRNAWTR